MKQRVARRARLVWRARRPVYEDPGPDWPVSSKAHSARPSRSRHTDQPRPANAPWHPLKRSDGEETMRLMYVTLRPAGYPPAQQYDSRMGARGPAGLGPTIVAESRWQVSILFGFLTLVFAVALVRGVTGAPTTAGRVAGRGSVRGPPGGLHLRLDRGRCGTPPALRSPRTPSGTYRARASPLPCRCSKGTSLTSFAGTAAAGSGRWGWPSWARIRAWT